MCNRLTVTGVQTGEGRPYRQRQDAEPLMFGAHQTLVIPLSELFHEWHAVGRHISRSRQGNAHLENDGQGFLPRRHESQLARPAWVG